MFDLFNNIFKEITMEDYVKYTKMNVNNIAIVFSPMLFGCDEHTTDPKILLANTKYETQIITAFIQELRLPSSYCIATETLN